MARKRRMLEQFKYATLTPRYDLTTLRYKYVISEGSYEGGS